MTVYAYDILSDYSREPVSGKYKFESLADAKKELQRRDYEKLDRQNKRFSRSRPRADYKIKWRGQDDPTSSQATSVWLGFIHGGELVYELRKTPIPKFERGKNPLSKNRYIVTKGQHRKNNYQIIDTVEKELVKWGGGDILEFTSQTAAEKHAAKLNGKKGVKVAKKKRSAKQLANDKRLGRLAKKRAAAKRKANPKKKKVVRKKARRKVAKKKAVRRKRNPQQTRKMRDYIVFKCKGMAVWFLTTNAKGLWVFTSDKGKAVRWHKKGDAESMAKVAARKRGMASWAVGVCPDDTTVAAIRATCKPGK